MAAATPTIAEQIAALKAGQADLKTQARDLKKTLKVTQKRAARLKKRAKEWACKFRRAG